MKGHRQNRKDEPSGLHRSLQRKGDSVYIFLFQTSFLCSERNLKVTWSERTSVLPVIKWISISPSHFPTEGSFAKHLGKDWMPLSSQRVFCNLIITPLNSSLTHRHLCSSWLPRYQLNLSWAWRWDAYIQMRGHGVWLPSELSFALQTCGTLGLFFHLSRPWFPNYKRRGLLSDAKRIWALIIKKKCKGVLWMQLSAMQ